MCWLARRHRRQASSHILIFTAWATCSHHYPVGAGLLAKAVYQLMNVLAGTPPSQASQLPHFDLHCLGDLLTPLPCGSGLARSHILIFIGRATCSRRLPVGAGLPAMAVSQLMNVLTETPPSQASQLPHFDLHRPGDLLQAFPCGSGLARDGGVSVDECVD